MPSEVQYLAADTLCLLGNLYPRGEESVEHIRMLAEALEGGAELPPILVEKRTLRVVDGQHRLQAHIRVYGDDARVPCILRVYASEEELFADAIRENAKHGLRFSREDYGRCVELADRLKISAEKLAPLLQVSRKTLDWARVTSLAPAPKVGVDPEPQRGKANAGSRAWNRRGLRGGSGPTVAEVAERLEEERTAARAATGPAGPADKVGRTQHHCQNLTLLLENGLVDANYRALVQDLAKLKIALNNYLARGQAKP